MIIQIPHQYSNRFGLFFTVFDENLEALGVQSYGISISTLEEVFHKVGHLEDPSTLMNVTNTIKSLNSSND
jgi:hypothetical protein